MSIDIWLINNLDDRNFGADRLISIPWNAGEWARYVIAGRIETPYGMFQDDDFLIMDDDFLSDALDMHRQYCPDHMLGVAGVGLQESPPHYSPGIEDGYAAILKGHFQLWPRKIVRRVYIPQHPSASDIYWSLDSGGGQYRHYVSKALRQRMKDLPRFDIGYEFRPEHYQEREEVCAAWLAENKRRMVNLADFSGQETEFVVNSIESRWGFRPTKEYAMALAEFVFELGSKND